MRLWWHGVTVLLFYCITVSLFVMFWWQGGMVVRASLPRFFACLGAMKKLCFCDFGVIFPPGGYPWSLPGSPGRPGGYQFDFLMLFRCPWGGFGTPFGSFGLPLDALGPHFGAQSRPQGEKRTVPGAHCVPESIWVAKSEGPEPYNVAKL